MRDRGPKNTQTVKPWNVKSRSVIMRKKSFYSQIISWIIWCGWLLPLKFFFYFFFLFDNPSGYYRWPPRSQQSTTTQPLHLDRVKYYNIFNFIRSVDDDAFVRGRITFCCCRGVNVENHWSPDFRFLRFLHTAILYGPRSDIPQSYNKSSLIQFEH